MLQFIKIGTGCIIDEKGAISYGSLHKKIAELEDYWNGKGTASAIVVSGAIALGKLVMDETRQNSCLNPLELQCYATVGQMELMKLYADISRRNVGQILVTEADLANPNDISEVLKYNASRGILTLINYNDGIVADEVRRDNDTIAAKLVVMTDARRLVILGNGYDGFIGKDGRVIERIHTMTDELYQMCKGKSHHGNGGFRSKLDAAKLMIEAGKTMIISNMKYHLEDIIDGNAPKTMFGN